METRLHGLSKLTRRDPGETTGLLSAMGPLSPLADFWQTSDLFGWRMPLGREPPTPADSGIPHETPESLKMR